MPRLIDADALIQAAEAALAVAQKAGDTREIIKYNMLLCALREAETVDPIRAAGGCYCRECGHRESIGGNDDYCVLHETFGSKFCGDGKPREAK